LNKLCRTYILLFLLLALCGSNVWAQLDGEVEWGYAHYETSSDDSATLEASHFTQRYSLMYSKTGLLAGGRAGFYDVGIGAEWGSFSTEINDVEFDNDAAKILYEGQIQIAPGGLPFRLNAYSYDTARIQFNRNNGNYPVGIDSQIITPYSLFNPSIVTDLNNGQTIVSGVQFMAGIRNGSYLGKYRELLSQWPRVLVDYRDVYRRDMTSNSPQKYRDRNLAFVSLNKKDNWFHYRIYNHEDYLYQDRDSNETVILLGTIDHTLKRQWINMTNWIRISTDGSYTESVTDWDRYDSKLYSLNFFTTMQRKSFSASSFANLQREQRGGTIQSTLDIPSFLNSNLNPDTSVRSSLQLWRERETRTDDRIGESYDRSEDAYHGTIHLEGLKHSRVQIDPSIEVEVDTGDRWEGNAIRGKVEAYSNRLRQQNITWYGMASLAKFDGTDQLLNETDLWESELQGGVSHRLRNIQIGADQTLLYGDGNYTSQTTRYMHAQTANGFHNSTVETSNQMNGTLFRSETTLYAEHTSPSRVRNRFQIYFKYQDQNGEKLDNLELSHRLAYQSRLWRVDMENSYATGDDSNYQVPSSGYLGSVFDARPFEDQFQHHSTVKFSPNNYWESSLETTATWANGHSGERNLLLQVEQEVERSFYASSSVRRRLGTISQSLIYEQFKDGVDKRAIIFSLAGNYYPTSYWRMGARVFYNHYDYRADITTLSLMTGLDFPLFRLDLSYDYGFVADSNIVAHRYEVNVRKTF